MKRIGRRTAGIAVTLTLLGAASVPMAGPAAALTNREVIEACKNPDHVVYGDMIFEDPDCVTTIVGTTQIWADPERVTSYHSQCATSGSVSFSSSFSKGTSFSFGLDLGGKNKMSSTYEVQAGVKIGWTWSWSQTYGETHTTSVSPFSRGWVEAKAPMHRSTVDIRADYDDGPDYTVRDYIDSPVEGTKPAYVGKSEPMTSQQLLSACASPKLVPEVSIGQPPVGRQYGPDYRIWTYDSSGRLRNSLSRKCIDLSQQSTGAGVPLVQNSCSSSASQKWEDIYPSGRTYQLYNAWANKCMAVTNKSTSNGATVIDWHCGSGEQTYKVYAVVVTPQGTSTPTVGYVLVNSETDKCVAPNYSNHLETGATIRQYACWW